MTAPKDQAAQLAAYRRFMALLREKALPLVLAQSQPKEAPREEAA